jgi:hypothetical protein
MEVRAYVLDTQKWGQEQQDCQCVHISRKETRKRIAAIEFCGCRNLQVRKSVGEAAKARMAIEPQFMMIIQMITANS